MFSNANSRTTVSSRIPLRRNPFEGSESSSVHQLTRDRARSSSTSGNCRPSPKTSGSVRPTSGQGSCHRASLPNRKKRLWSDTSQACDHPRVQQGCFCEDSPEDCPPPLSALQLEDQVEILASELYRQKGENLILRRDLLVLRKIIKAEVGGNAVPVDNLLPLASDRRWRGRQERRLHLHRVMRDLSESLGEEGAPSGGRAKSSEAGSTSDEGRYLRCLETERREMLRQAEREMTRWTADRDLLKIKVESFSKKNQTLTSELRSLKEQIADEMARVWDDEVWDSRLQTLENQLRTQLRKGAEDRRRVCAAEAEVTRNTREVTEARAKLQQEEQVSRETETTLEELRKEESSLSQRLKEVEIEKVERAEEARAELDRMELAFGDLATRAKDAFTPHETDRSTETTDGPLPDSTSGMSAEESCDEEEGVDPSICRKYRSLLESLRRRNREYAGQVKQLAGKISDAVASLLGQRRVLCKKTCEVDVLKGQLKRLSGRKSSSGSRQEAALEGKRCLQVLRVRRLLKDLIENVLDSRRGDFDLYKDLLARMRDASFPEK